MTVDIRAVSCGMIQENAYIVSPDPVKNFDGETQYPDTYVRILCQAETSNKAQVLFAEFSKAGLIKDPWKEEEQDV